MFASRRPGQMSGLFYALIRMRNLPGWYCAQGRSRDTRHLNPLAMHLDWA
jgi:hypothetical protein